MRVKDIIKKQTTIIAIAVVLVAMTAMGASYAIFFDIKKNNADQVITAGTLKVTISGVSALTTPEVLDDTGGKNSTAINYTVKNEDGDQSKSNLPNAYTMYIYADDENQIDLDKIKIDFSGSDLQATTKGTHYLTEIVTATETGALAIPTGETGCSVKGDPDVDLSGGFEPRKCVGYKLESGALVAGASANTRTLRVWVDESSVTDEITEKKLSLRLYIVSEVAEQS